MQSMATSRDERAVGRAPRAWDDGFIDLRLKAREKGDTSRKNEFLGEVGTMGEFRGQYTYFPQASFLTQADGESAPGP